MVIKNWVFLFLILLVLFVGFSSASPSPPAKIVSGIVSNVASALFKWLLSLKPTTKTAIPSRSMMKFEGGYIVETVFDGRKLGIEPYSVGMSPSGELLVLDSQNSNIHKISSLPVSRYSRPKLIAGSPEGYSGHVDGKLREARMNNPKGFTVDDSGNIYVADTMNMAIRKISDAGIVTIAGGNWGRGGGHVDGPSEDAKFSNDFDVLYVGSSCSLLVVDRGNQAIREIQLHDDDCSDYQHDGDLHLGIAVLVVAVFFGYMLALLQRRVATMFSSTNDPTPRMKGNRPAPYQRPIKSVRPPLIPPEYDPEREEEGIFVSVGKLFASTGATIGEMFGGIFSGFRKKPMHHYPLHFQQNAYQQQQPQYPIDAWPMQESFMIPRDDEPLPPQARDPNTRRSYPLMTSKDPEKPRHFKQSRYFYSEQSGEYFNQQQQHQQHHQRHYSSGPQTCYEQRCETSEIVFGAVQEQVNGKQGAVMIKAVDYGNPVYSNQNLRSRHNYAGYAYGY